MATANTVNTMKGNAISGYYRLIMSEPVTNVLPPVKNKNKILGD